MKQSQPLRIENPAHGSFTTSKTVAGRLWFVNNPELEEWVLGYAGRYQQKYQAKLYALVFQGNHIHTSSQFPDCNRAAFFRDLNARTAEAVRITVPSYEGGHVFARRYSEQALVTPQDFEEEFFYCALQPVRAGLCERIGDYPGYNSVWDALEGRVRKYKVVDWTGYKKAKRRGLNPKIKDYTTSYTLEYSRLPGYEHLSQEEYKKRFLAELERRRLELVREWKAKGHQFMTKDQLRKVVVGSKPVRTKQSRRFDARPLVLTKSVEVKRAFLEWYFCVYNEYKFAVRKFLDGDLTVTFPPFTYLPPGRLVHAR